MGIELSKEIRALLDGPNYAHLATIMRDGSPHVATVWVAREGDLIVGFEGQAIAAVDDLHRALTWKRIDIMTPVTVIRRGERLTIEIIPVEKHG